MFERRNIFDVSTHGSAFNMGQIISGNNAVVSLILFIVTGRA